MKKIIYKIAIPLVVMGSWCFSAFGQTDTLEGKYEKIIRDIDDYIIKEEYREGVTFTTDALSSCENEIGTKHLMCGEISSGLSTLYMRLGEYKNAIPYAQNALDVEAKNTDKKSSQYEVMLNNLGMLYTRLGKYEKALPLILESGRITLNKQGSGHSDYGMHLSNLASTYFHMGRLDESILHYSKSLNFFDSSDAFGDEHSIVLSNLAQVYLINGQYEKALQLNLKALGTTKKRANSVDYAVGIGITAEIYSKIGNFERSISMCKDALIILERTVGEDNPYYIRGLNLLTESYISLNKHDLALKYAFKSKKIIDSTQGIKYQDYAIPLVNIALVYSDMKLYKKSLYYNLEALDVVENAVGKKHTDYAICAHNLSYIYKYMGEYEKALTHALEAYKILQLKLDEKNSNYGKSIHLLGDLYNCMGDTSKAIHYYELLLKNGQNLLLKQIRYASESIQSNWIKDTKRYFNKQQSILSKYGELVSLEKIISQNVVLNNYTLESKKRLFAEMKIADHKTKILFQSWLNHKKYLARQLSLPIAERKPDIDSITLVADQLETQLAAKSKEFATARKTIELKDVQETLKPTEALLQFSDFRYYDINKWTDSTLYVAYLVYPNKAPEMVYLFEQKQLDSLFTDSTSNTSDFYTMRTFTPEKSKNILNKKLYNLIWKPLLPHLEGINTLYINPSGLLHKINLAAIPIDSTSRISDKFKVNYISSARNFVLPKEKKYENTALVLGGLDYDEYAPSTDSTAIYYYHDYNEVAVASTPKGSLRTLRDSTWSPLKGAKIEAKKISRLLSKKSYKITHLADKNGTEHAIKYYGRDSILSPRILHIATHGFSFPAPQDKPKNSIGDENPYRMAEDPLFRSGLILSGANKAWQGQSPPKGQEDGILTAYEISHLDLTETELVVLSACKTGVGDIDSHEGVYGLQRGFKLAGVKYIIMSLWDVPDNETQEMMVLFYKKWLDGGLEIPDAFRAAQEEMREKYEDRPELWAGFVLVE